MIVQVSVKPWLYLGRSRGRRGRFARVGAGVLPMRIVLPPHVTAPIVRPFSGAFNLSRRASFRSSPLAHADVQRLDHRADHARSGTARSTRRRSASSSTGRSTRARTASCRAARPANRRRSAMTSTSGRRALHRGGGRPRAGDRRRRLELHRRGDRADPPRQEGRRRRACWWSRPTTTSRRRKGSTAISRRSTTRSTSRSSSTTSRRERRRHVGRDHGAAASSCRTSSA